jgi:hypothetical protein
MSDDFAVLLGAWLFCSSDVTSTNALAPGLKQSVITPNCYARNEMERLQMLMAFVCSTKTFFSPILIGIEDRT